MARALPDSDKIQPIGPDIDNTQNCKSNKERRDTDVKKRSRGETRRGGGGDGPA